KNPFFHQLLFRWNRVVSVRTEWMAACDTACGEPAAADGTVAPDRLGGVIGARRQEGARAPKGRRQQDLKGSKERQELGRGERQDRGGGDVRGCFGNPLQGPSGWRRAARAWE